MSALSEIRCTIDFLSGKIALHRPDMLSLKDGPSSVSAMWTALVKRQSFSTVVCSTCNFSAGVLLHCSNNLIYLSLSGCRMTSTGYIIPCWIFQSATHIITPGESCLFSDSYWRSGKGAHPSGVHDIINKQPWEQYRCLYSHKNMPWPSVTLDAE